jgi:hypothetical protein
VDIALISEKRYITKLSHPHLTHKLFGCVEKENDILREREREREREKNNHHGNRVLGFAL